MEAVLENNIHATTSLKEYACVYAAIHKTGVPDNKNLMMDDLVTSVLTQYHVSKGLKSYGNKGVEAVLKELQQLHDCMIIEQKFHQDLDKKDKTNLLRYLMFLKEKQERKIKGRGCTNRQKQRVYQ